METKVKTFKSKLEVLPGKREVIAVISTDSVDSDNEVLIPSGLVRKQFQGMPVLWAHQHETPAIGTVKWVKVEDNLIKAKYRIHDKSQLANEVWELLKDGILNSHSVGCTYLETGYPSEQELKARPDWENVSRLVTKWDMHEFSVCNIPANADCVALAVGKGIKLLGEPRPECWTWKEPDKPKTGMTDAASQLLLNWAASDAKPAIELPPIKGRKIKDLEKEIARRLEKRIQQTEILLRLKGKA